MIYDFLFLTNEDKKTGINGRTYDTAVNYHRPDRLVLAGHQCAGTDLSPDCDAPMPSPANCAATAIKLDEPPERVIR